jgi:hypothetical protein
MTCFINALPDEILCQIIRMRCECNDFLSVRVVLPLVCRRWNRLIHGNTGKRRKGLQERLTDETCLIVRMHTAEAVPQGVLPVSMALKSAACALRYIESRISRL